MMKRKSTLNEDEILTPFDPSEEENGEAGSESVDGIPPAQEDGEESIPEENEQGKSFRYRGTGLQCGSDHRRRSRCSGFWNTSGGRNSRRNNKECNRKEYRNRDTAFSRKTTPEHFAVQDIHDSP